MGCGSSGASKADAPKAKPTPLQLGPSVAPAGAPQPAAGATSAAPAQAGFVPATGSTVASTEPAAATNPGAAVKTGFGGFADRLATTAVQTTQAKTGKTPDEWFQKAKAAAVDAKTQMAGQMEAALKNSDNKQINSILDSALAGSALGPSAPESMRKAANQVATRQLNEAIASEDPKQLKGALVAAKRLNATDVPEFGLAIEKYKQVKKLPAGWDVKNMVLQRKGDKMVAKMDVRDPAVQEKFQRLLDLTHRKVYTRDRLGQPVPDRLELVSVTAVTNEDLWGDYMARRETIRRELEADQSEFAQYAVETMEGRLPSAASEEKTDPTAADITASLAEDFASPLLPDVNEVFLFHGTSEAAAEAITTGNFKVNLAGSNAGTLYGRGVYLAENASKSDEYTWPAKNGLRYLLLCRTVLGRVHYLATKETDPRSCEEACLHGKFHSVLGDRKLARGTFREFVVFDEDQVYANYILGYRRIDPPEEQKKSQLQVICPPGTGPGATVELKTPDGQTIRVVVPPGVVAGQAFVVQY